MQRLLTRIPSLRICFLPFLVGLSRHRAPCLSPRRCTDNLILWRCLNHGKSLTYLKPARRTASYHSLITGYRHSQLSHLDIHGRTGRRKTEEGHTAWFLLPGRACAFGLGRHCLGHGASSHTTFLMPMLTACTSPTYTTWCLRASGTAACLFRLALLMAVLWLHGIVRLGELPPPLSRTANIV